MSVSPANISWATASVSGNKVVIKTTTENDGWIAKSQSFEITYKGTTIQLSVTQNLDFNPKQTVNIGGIEWMKYNLAKSKLESGGPTFATKLPSECVDDPIRTKSHGKFYQWDVGNKSWSSTDITVSGWNSTNPPTTNDTWVEDNDPCPDGYRIPTRDEFETLLSSSTHTNGNSDWSASNYGYVILKSGNLTLEFPAVGFRNGLSGSLGGNGTGGRYWSSTQIEEYGSLLYFSNSMVILSDTGSKITGYSVRCVKK